MKQVIRSCLLAALLVGVGAATSLFAADEIKLIRAFSAVGSRYDFVWHTLYMNIAAKNLAPDQKVFVHMDDGTGHWIDVAARFVHTTGEGYSLWSVDNLAGAFAAQAPCPPTVTDHGPTGRICDLIFALQLRAQGATYLDDNNGLLYHLKAGSGSLLGAAFPVSLESAEAFNFDAHPTAGGGVFVKNLGQEQTVTILYSFDQWKTTQSVPAQFQSQYFHAYGAVPSPNAQRVEYWSFHFPVPPPAASVDLAVRYQVDGREYWDNNFGQHYHLSVPPSQ